MPTLPNHKYATERCGAKINDVRILTMTEILGLPEQQPWWRSKNQDANQLSQCKHYWKVLMQSLCIILQLMLSLRTRHLKWSIYLSEILQIWCEVGCSSWTQKLASTLNSKALAWLLRTLEVWMCYPNMKIKPSILIVYLKTNKLILNLLLKYSCFVIAIYFMKVCNLVSLSL